MKFLLITLIAHAPGPVTGTRKPSISSSPPVVLGHIAALTSRIRFQTLA